MPHKPKIPKYQKGGGEVTHGYVYFPEKKHMGTLITRLTNQKMRDEKKMRGDQAMIVRRRYRYCEPFDQMRKLD